MNDEINRHFKMFTWNDEKLASSPREQASAKVAEYHHIVISPNYCIFLLRKLKHKPNIIENENVFCIQRMNWIFPKIKYFCLWQCSTKIINVYS